VLLPRWVGQWVGQDLDLLLGWAPFSPRSRAQSLRTQPGGPLGRTGLLPLTAGSQGTLGIYFLVPQFPHRTSCEVPVRISESLVQGKHSVNIAIQAHPAWF
jgi:hypothetical protein